MPDAVSVEIAKDLTTYLAGQSFSISIDPERSYADWDLELKDSDTLHVDVVAVTTEQKHELAARGKARFEVPVDIAIRKRFGTTSQVESTGRINLDEVDELVYLTEEVYDSLIQQRLPTDLASVWLETKIVVSPDRESLRERRQFMSIVRVTFERHKVIQ
jgi:hypothetical protein